MNYERDSLFSSFSSSSSHQASQCHKHFRRFSLGLWACHMCRFTHGFLAWRVCARAYTLRHHILITSGKRAGRCGMTTKHYCFLVHSSANNSNITSLPTQTNFVLHASVSDSRVNAYWIDSSLTRSADHPAGDSSLAACGARNLILLFFYSSPLILTLRFPGPAP